MHDSGIVHYRPLKSLPFGTFEWNIEVFGAAEGSIPAQSR